ncbi:Fur family transcriptional regulator, peroxide stress response regulator [Lachnospiraceae bacterium XBB2008]|nr:Fur family transcriptional regulator, peroxide stress response regulator [Lachnospiraceae bacterium XBB2008]
MALKYSRQREAIKENLMSRRDHPTADAVYLSIREEYPNISLGTVYRNLQLLTELGELQKIRVGDGLDHFDADTSTHYHFYCNKCGAVIDMDMDAIEEINDIASKTFDGIIESHNLTFSGICGRCIPKS